jgi:hypothetical protein
MDPLPLCRLVVAGTVFSGLMSIEMDRFLHGVSNYPGDDVTVTALLLAASREAIL